VKRRRTARIGRRPASLLAGLLLTASLAGLGSCARDKKPNQQALYDSISRQIELGELDTAREAAWQAWKASPDSEDGWRFKAQYILTSLYRGDLAGGQALLKESVPAAYSDLGPRYKYLQAYLAVRLRSPSAFSLAESARAAASSQGDRKTEAEALILQGFVEGFVDRDKQLELLEHALQIARKNQLTFLEADALSEIGLTLHNHGQYSNAVSYLLRASAKAKDANARLMRNVVLGNLGECYLNLGDLDRAALSLQEARSNLRSSDPQSLRSDINMELGKVYSLGQENGKAIGYFKDAVEIVRADRKLASYVPANEKLAAGLIEEHQLEEAERYNELGHEALKNEVPPPRFEQAYYYLNRADIAAQRNRPQDALPLYRRVLQMPGDELSSLRWAAYARLAELQSQTGHPAEARKNFEGALNAIEENRSLQTATEHQITFLSALIRFYQQYVDFLIKQGNRQEALAVADSSRASVLTQGLNSSRKEPNFMERVRAEARKSNTAILFYWLAPQKSYLWLITPKSEDFQELPPQDQITQDVQTYSKAIQAADQDLLNTPNSAGLHLYETLIKPVSSHLEKGMRIVIVPDGALHGLNFETLLVKDNSPHYWLNDVSITVAPSLRILLDKSSTTQASTRALVIGDSDYSSVSDKYPPLPESKKEVAGVSTLFPNSTVLTQSQAVPEAYEKAQPGAFSLIHFSAHVEANENSPLDSAIILSPGEYGRRELYARDLMSPKNHLNADLVTISGCNSVGKKVLSGEGMVGFAWAAFEAGARNAVTSLWEVDDRSTTELMNHFYTEVTHGKSYAAALREAKLHMLEGNFKKPYYWAPFQLYSRNLSDRP